MKGRAETLLEKKSVTMRLFVAWLSVPELRFGQLIVNACGRDPFYLEDEELASKVEDYVSRIHKQGDVK